MKNHYIVKNELVASADSRSMQACAEERIGMWLSMRALARGSNYLTGLVIFASVAMFAWFIFVSGFYTTQHSTESFRYNKFFNAARISNTKLNWTD